MKVLILLLALLSTPLAGGENGTDTVNIQRPKSLKDCMEYAVEHCSDILIQRSKVDDARLERRDAILTAFTPLVEASSYGYYRWGRSIDPETNTYVTTTSLNNGWAVSAGITLFDGFSALDNIKIARTSLAMGQDLEHQEEDRVCLATMEAYYNVVYYTLLVDILSEQVDNARSALTLASRQEELGVKGYADVVQMKADLADREYELVCARNSLTGARISLEDIMLWPVGEPLEIDTDEVLLSGGEEEDCSGHAGTDGTQTLDGIVRSAQKTLPSVLIAKGTLDNAKYALHTARWQFLPTLSLYGGWSTSYYTYPGQAGYTPTPYWKQFVNNGGEYLQLSLNIPIYDRLSKLTLLSKRRNEYRRAEISYDKSLRDVESEVRRAVSDLNGTRAELTRASLRAELQEEAFRLNSRKYEQGLISAIEYNTASANHLKAEAERLNALLQYRLKSHVVEYYGGTRYIDQK